MSLQVVAVAAIALLMLLEGTKQAGSAVLGGVIGVLPNAYFAWAATRPFDRASQRAAGRLIVQSVMKLVVAIMGMVIVMRTARFEALGFFCAFATAWAVQLLAPLLVRGDNE